MIDKLKLKKKLENIRKKINSLSEEEKSLFHNLRSLKSATERIKFFRIGGIIRGPEDWDRRRMNSEMRMNKVKEKYELVKDYSRTEWKKVLNKVYNDDVRYNELIFDLKKYKIID